MSFWCVIRLVFGNETAWWATGLVIVALVALWVVLPLAYRWRIDREVDPPMAREA